MVGARSASGRAMVRRPLCPGGWSIGGAAAAERRGPAARGAVASARPPAMCRFMASNDKAGSPKTPGLPSPCPLPGWERVIRHESVSSETEGSPSMMNLRGGA